MFYPLQGYLWVRLMAKKKKAEEDVKELDGFEELEIIGEGKAGSTKSNLKEVKNLEDLPGAGGRDLLDRHLRKLAVADGVIAIEPDLVALRAALHQGAAMAELHLLGLALGQAAIALAKTQRRRGTATQRQRR